MRERERESLIRRINNYKEVEDNHVVFIVCHMASYSYYYYCTTVQDRP